VAEAFFIGAGVLAIVVRDFGVAVTTAGATGTARFAGADDVIVAGAAGGEIFARAADVIVAGAAGGEI